MSDLGDLTACDVVLTGQVQGVGFRFHCLREAERLGVVGWVRNEPDGTVAGHFEGTPSAVDSLVDWCRSGPSYAGVERIDVVPAEPSGASSFQAH